VDRRGRQIVKRLAGSLILIVALGVALVLTAGGGETGEGDTLGPPVPQLDVPRLEGGEAFALDQLASAETPTLLWFWAPWCEVCNHEAPEIERLASQARGELAVVAIGGRDDAANGPAFVARHRLRTPTVLFDESMASWRAYGIPGQPGAVLLDRTGHERARWFGAFDTSLALDAARAL
jgi:thiol-disulfide isomerase/thioredoxin